MRPHHGRLRGNHSFGKALAVGATIAAASVVLAIVAGIGQARAHEAPDGWSYPFSCCSDYDCRPIEGAMIHERPDGYHVPSGEVVGYQDARIKHSPDGQFHWCSVAGADDGNTICLFVPPRGM